MKVCSVVLGNRITVLRCGVNSNFVFLIHEQNEYFYLYVQFTWLRLSVRVDHTAGPLFVGDNT